MKKKPWETLSTEVVNKNPWTEYVHEKYVLPTGGEGDYYYLRTPANSVTIVPVLPNGKILMHRQYRYLYKKTSLAFPSGGGKLEMSDLDSAIAELKEETGYSAQQWKALSVIAPSTGIVKEQMVTFLAWQLEPGESQPEETEEFELVEMSIEEVDQVIASGEVWDGFVLCSWMLARPHVVEYIEKLTK